VLPTSRVNVPIPSPAAERWVQPNANQHRDGVQPLHPDLSGRNGPAEELQGLTQKGACAWSTARGSGFAEDSGK